MEEGLINRRQVLTGGILAALGTLWLPGEAGAQDLPLDGVTVTFDVACLGPSFAPDMKAALDLDKQDTRGIGFFVEGVLYPGGTIPKGEGFDIDSVPALGHWFCHGWFMGYAGRPNPGVVTVQEYILGRISEAQQSPLDQLHSSGLESARGWTNRIVTGGTGRYRGVRGEVIQEVIGHNKTILNVFNVPAPTFRFYFKI